MRLFPPILLTALTIASSARADETSTATSSGGFPSLKARISGYVDVDYAYNFNRPTNGANFTATSGTTAKRANAFNLSQAVIDFAIDPSPVGVHLAIGYGTGFAILHQNEPTGPGIGPLVWQNVLQASVSYKLPVGKDVIVEGGIFPSYIGLEQFASKDNWTYTRAWMGEFSPYYEAGIKLSAPLGNGFAAQLHVMNGWAIIGENNEGKAVGAQLTWSGKKVSATLNLFAGPELANDGSHWRIFEDAILTYNATSRLQLAASADYGLQELPHASTSMWFAAALLGRYALVPKLALALRGEVYRDAGGFISGTVQTLSEGTVTLEYRPVDMLILKLEGRYDHSSASVFSARSDTNTAATSPNEALVTLGTVATF